MNETITADDVARLLAAAAARDQRTVGETDLLAWYEDLNTAAIGYPDARSAITHYYANVWPRQEPGRRFRVTAPVVIELVRELRRNRLEAANYVFDPRYRETGAQSAARLRHELAHVASTGEAPRQIGHPLHARPVAELVAGVAAKRVLPPEIAEVINRLHPPAETISCPACHARPGSACTFPAIRKTRPKPGWMHPGRTAAWAVAVTACPDCRAAAGDICRHLGQPYHDVAHPARIVAASPKETEA